MKNFQNKSWGDKPKMMYKATCSECGKTCEVPFRPTGEKPVYCNDCFNKMRPSAQAGDPSDTRASRPSFDARPPKRDFNDRFAPRSDARPSFNKSDSRPAFKPTNNDKQLSEINTKLDRLINAIEKMNFSATVSNLPAQAGTKKAVKKAPAKKKK